MHTIHFKKTENSCKTSYHELIFKKFWCFIWGLIQPIFFVVLVIMWAYSFSEYTLSYDINLLPPQVSNIRAWALFSSIVFIAATSLGFWMTYRLWKCSEMKCLLWNLRTLGLLNFLFIGMYWKDLFTANGFGYIWQYIRRENVSYTNLSMWVKTFWTHSKKDNHFKLTSVYIFALMVTLVGTIFVIFGPEIRGEKYAGIHGFFIFQYLSYFTVLTNLLCFIFVVSNLFMKNQKILSNHTLLLNISAYICVVSIGYWSSHAPAWAEGKVFLNFTIENWFELLVTFWFHTITPLMMLILFICTVKLSPQVPLTFKQTLGKYVVYPTFYGVYLYSLPFLVPFSVYGAISNTNSYLVWVTEFGVYYGTPFALLFAPVIAGVFILVYYFYWMYANKVGKSIETCKS